MREIIITGASRGLGKALAIGMSNKETRVHLIARSSLNNVLKEVVNKGAVGFKYKFDLGKTDKLDSLMQQIFSNFYFKESNEFILINNAGVIGPVGPAGKYDVKDYKNNLEVNFVAPILLTHLFIGKLQDMDVKKKVGIITSGAAVSPNYGWGHYCSSKAGLNMFTQCVGIEQEKEQFPIKIFAFRPGIVDTSMQKDIRDTTEDDFPRVKEFKEWKEEGDLLSPDFVAEKFSETLDDDSVQNGDIINIQDLI